MQILDAQALVAPPEPSQPGREQPISPALCTMCYMDLFWLFRATFPGGIEAGDLGGPACTLRMQQILSRPCQRLTAFRCVARSGDKASIQSMFSNAPQQRQVRKIYTGAGTYGVLYHRSHLPRCVPSPNGTATFCLHPALPCGGSRHTESCCISAW